MTVRRRSAVLSSLGAALLLAGLVVTGCASDVVTAPHTSTVRPPQDTAAPSVEATPPPATTSTVAPGVLPAAGLAGVNETDCRSELRPVVLLPGTFSDLRRNYSSLVPDLLAAGYCVYGLNFADRATAPVRTSATGTALLLRTVAAFSPDGRVDVIGYSQGGLVLRTALRENGVAGLVHTAVLIAPSFHGTDTQLLGLLPAAVCPACDDQRAGSPLLRDLDAGGDLDGDVIYAVLSSRLDEVVTPYTAQVPEGPPDRVFPLVIQDRCPDERTPHGALPHAGPVRDWVLAVLAGDGIADLGAVRC